MWPAQSLPGADGAEHSPARPPAGPAPSPGQAQPQIVQGIGRLLNHGVQIPRGRFNGRMPEQFPQGIQALPGMGGISMQQFAGLDMPNGLSKGIEW